MLGTIVIIRSVVLQSSTLLDYIKSRKSASYFIECLLKVDWKKETRHPSMVPHCNVRPTLLDAIKNRKKQESEDDQEAEERI